MQEQAEGKRRRRFHPRTESAPDRFVGLSVCRLQFGSGRDRSHFSRRLGSRFGLRHSFRSGLGQLLAS